VAAVDVNFAARPLQVTKENGRRGFYREDLAALVLIADSHKHLFDAAPPLYAIYMGVAEKIWDQQLLDPYRSLRDIYDRWLGAARAVIAGWIRGES
jgi:hypothetical protein